MLKLDKVTKVYRVGTFGGKELYAVNNVSFEIGESGSGKSTIGKMILRLIAETEGTITFNGTDVSTLSGSALKEYYRNVQGVFQDPFSSYNPIFKADRIFETIRNEFFPDINDMEWNDKINRSLQSVGLNPDQVLNKFPHQLSGGQLQRLLIARALLLDVQFLVADELISMLDASTRVDVLNLLAELQSRGLSILFITHDLSLGYYISQKSVILKDGVAVEMGLTEKIYENPLHPYTRMLMASVPRLDKKWDEVELDTAGIELPDGYTFYERTSAMNGASAGITPTLMEVEPDHFVACVEERHFS